MADDTQKFDDTLISRENRKSNYRKWSERAVVVGFNDEEQAYDIVITTEKTLGDNVRSLNRTIRKVKAVLDPAARTYLPGESIIVGYVDDRREHPIIVGLGDSSGHTCIKVTLGVTSTTPTIEGPAAPSVESPAFNIFFPLSVSCLDPNTLDDAGPDDDGVCTVDCDALLPEIRLQANGGQPPYTWQLSPSTLAGCTLRGVGGTGEPVADGANDSRFVVTAPFTVGSTDFAFSKFADSVKCDHIFPSCGSVGGFVVATHTLEQHRAGFDCDGNTHTVSPCDIGVPGPSPPNSTLVFNEFACFASTSCGSHQASFPVRHGRLGSNADFDVGRIPTLNACFELDCTLVLNDDLSLDPCKHAREVGGVNDVRTPALKVAGCCPCRGAFEGVTITVTDSQGTAIATTITVEPE